MGIKTDRTGLVRRILISEKPPHHMGIKTQYPVVEVVISTCSEKPPHHMGIKTQQLVHHVFR